MGGAGQAIGGPRGAGPRVHGVSAEIAVDKIAHRTEDRGSHRTTRRRFCGSSPFEASVLAGSNAQGQPLVVLCHLPSTATERCRTEGAGPGLASLAQEVIALACALRHSSTCRVLLRAFLAGWV